ncbi:MAG: HlyD family secretion protein, partial [Cyanobacteria bacterium]|nr:HlyD family secretion protein [Cyanobacteriota bacterium]
ALQAAKQNLTTAELNRKRLEDLYEKGLRSQRDRELAELDYIRAKTDVQRAEAALEVAFKDKTISSLDKTKVEADTSATLDGLSASIASAQETIASTNSDILKLEVDLSNLKGRTNQRVIVAPMDGRIVRLLKLGAGETVDSGENLATLVPKTLDQAVEIYVNDNDIPLVSIGDHVRLQFAGWPALQFTGWPSVAVGTFPGKVKVIDMVDDGKKRYRVLVRPDWETVKTHKDEHWPSPEHLRPGGAVVGWILISSKPMFGMPRGTVPLGYELWRQFNGFPPTVERDAIKTDSDYTTDATSGINEKKDDGKGTKRKAKSK